MNGRYAVLIQSAGELGGYIDRYGLPLVGLIVLAWLGYLIVWKVLIPRLDKRDQIVQEQNEKLILFMGTQLNEAREARTQEVEKFVKTIDDTIGKHTEAINALSQEVKKKRDPRHQ